MTLNISQRLTNLGGNICLVRFNESKKFGFGDCYGEKNEVEEYHIPEFYFEEIYHPELLNKTKDQF